MDLTNDSYCYLALTFLDSEKLWQPEDKNFMGSLASQYMKKGSLSEKQMFYLRKSLPYYQDILTHMDPSKIAVQPKLGGENTVPKAPVGKEMTLDGLTLVVRYPFDQELREEITRSVGRMKWNGQKKQWEKKVSLLRVMRLRDLGFEWDEKLQAWYEGKFQLNKVVKPIFDFFLCPLYGACKNIEEVANAKRGISKNTESVESFNRKSEKGSNSRSAGQGESSAQRKCERSCVETKDVRYNKGGHASPRSEGTSSCGIEESSKNTRSEFQGREWTGADTNGEISRESIVSLWLHKGISNPDKTCENYVSSCSRCLQSRLCQSGGENSNRIRRPESQRGIVSTEGQKEDGGIDSPWVDCPTLASLQSLVSIPHLQKGLFKFQFEDVNKIHQINGKALIASEMGLGKTAQALSWLQLHPEARPALIVAPATLKLNWSREIRIWMGDVSTIILSGTKADPAHVRGNDIVIINYDIMDDWKDTLKASGFKVMIIDEAHRVKNSKAQRTKAVLDVAKGIPHRIALTGTPIVNKPVEAFNIISFVDDELFPTFSEFAYQYCAPKEIYIKGGRTITDFSGCSNMQELHEILTGTIMIRRTKEQELEGLPPKIHQVLPFEIDKREYNKVLSDFFTWLLTKKSAKDAERSYKAEAMTKLEYLKQVAVKEALPQCIEWIEDYLEEDGKLIVFATHKFVIDSLMEKFGDIAIKVDGSVKNDDRDKAVQAFQKDDKVRLFVGNIQAAGVGLTLTAASSVAFLELPWTPGDVDQAADRAHRIGQTKMVNIYYLMAAGTIQEALARLIDKKRKVISQVVDGKEVEGEDLFETLLDELKNNK